MSTGEDAVVVGGGAAGIAAARMLHDAGRKVLLVEAADRLGGRAHTVCDQGIALDLGCGWLHSAQRNPWTAIALERGFAVATDPPRWDRQWQDLGFPAADQAAFHEAMEGWRDRAMAALNGPDRPIGDFISADDRWRPLIDAISGYANGAPLDRVSLYDWAAYENAATDDNWRVRAGYGALVIDHARGLPIRLGTAVTRIDHGAATLRVETEAGTIETRHVIIAVPTPVLADGRIIFDPPLPDKQAAAAALPLGLADKVFLRIEGADFPRNAHLVGNPRSARTASYQVGPLGLPIIEAFFGGDCAEALEAEGAGAAAAFAIDEITNLLGGGWRTRLSVMATTAWRHEPLIGGSYSHAKVGHAPARARLAAGVDGRLFFAGEACSHEDFSTAHGACQTGVVAAQAVLHALGG